MIAGPLTGSFERLAALDPWFGASVGRPEGDRWVRLGDVPGAVSAWVDELAAGHGGHRDVAGSYVSGWLADAVALATTVLLVLERRVPDPEGPVWLLRHHDGWFERVAFERPTVLVAPGDPDADHDDATVVDHEELAARHADGVVSRLEPVLDAVRAVAPFGRRGQWGSVADVLAGAATHAARTAGRDPDEAWRAATIITDAVASRVRWLRSRPRPYRVPRPTGDAVFPIRSSCCLYYKTQPQPPDPRGDSYCTTCPFRDDQSRHERLVAYLGAIAS